MSRMVTVEKSRPTARSRGSEADSSMSFTVNSLDITSIDGLKGLRNTLDKHAAPGLVEWHFAGVHNRWTRKALSFAGFGFPATTDVKSMGNWCPAYTVTTSLAGATEEERKEMEIVQRSARVRDEELGKDATESSETQVHEKTSNEKRRFQPLYGVDRPFFHLDLHDAVDAAVRDAKKVDLREARTTCALSAPSETAEQGAAV